ncbi:MAG: LytTR family transcriptional regulator DNA-binding domain-containing protein [Clostridiales bacterium]|nr:LytTR family transcriptional regulator DNA-binding domain-containing protein [Clostridiales bacterium]
MIHAVLNGTETDMLLLEQGIRKETALQTNERVKIERLRNEKVIREVFSRFLQKPDTGEIFVVENKEERQRIPYGELLYFEARMKKVYACTENAEYGFYDTIDHLEKKLSGHFVRCHRSYLVNRNLIEGVKLSQNCLILRGNIRIPLSRSWKEPIKELVL